MKLFSDNAGTDGGLQICSSQLDVQEQGLPGQGPWWRCRTRPGGPPENVTEGKDPADVTEVEDPSDVIEMEDPSEVRRSRLPSLQPGASRERHSAEESI